MLWKSGNLGYLRSAQSPKWTQAVSTPSVCVEHKIYVQRTTVCAKRKMKAAVFALCRWSQSNTVARTVYIISFTQTRGTGFYSQSVEDHRALYFTHRSIENGAPSFIWNSPFEIDLATTVPVSCAIVAPLWLLVLRPKASTRTRGVILKTLSNAFLGLTSDNPSWLNHTEIWAIFRFKSDI